MQMAQRGVVSVEGGARDGGVLVSHAADRARRLAHGARERARLHRRVAVALRTRTRKKKCQNATKASAAVNTEMSKRYRGVSGIPPQNVKTPLKRQRHPS